MNPTTTVSACCPRHKDNTEDCNHDWAYKSDKKRVCLKCKRKEILFSISSFCGAIFEDWRKSL